MSIKYADEDGDLDTIVTYRKQDQVIISPVDTSTEDTTSIIEIQTKKTLQLFPNPASTQIKVLGNDIAANTKVHISNMSGSIYEVLEFNSGEFDILELPKKIKNLPTDIELLIFKSGFGLYNLNPNPPLPKKTLSSLSTRGL